MHLQVLVVPAGGVAAECLRFEVFGEVHAEVWPLYGAALVAGTPQVGRKSGNAVLLEVLVHEGVDDGVVEGVGEADGLDHCDDHVHRDLVVVLLQVICVNNGQVF